MKLLSTLLLVFFGAWASGCAAPPKGRVPVAPEAVEHSDLLIDDTLIDQKIHFLKSVLADRDLSERDRETAAAVLIAYQQLKESASSRPTETDYQRLILSLFRAVSLMDETYYGEGEVRRDDAGAFALFAEKRQSIIDLYLRQDFKGVIQATRNLESIFGPDALTREIGLLFALSLAEEGDLEQAVQVGEAIADELEPVPDVMLLRSRIARWQMALGRKARALETYERLTDNQDERAALVSEVGRQLSAAEKERPPYPPESAGPATAEGPGDLWQEGGYTMDRLLQQVRSLVQEHAYSKARILILRERIRMGEGPENELLDRELEEIDRHEAEFQAQKQMRDDYLKETQETAREMIEKEDYEAAIDAFSRVEASQELDPESVELKKRAVESLINKERNRAAELFLAAKKAGDPSKKKELLDSAYAILKTLIDKYPSSPLNPKLKSHMAIVQNELDRLK
ncbi:MAG: hypothetical protein K9N21_18685 [Deltaproteobacteria bacterium]|nr:hypothetical protein [Deltaproteobacteria bacterium]